MARDPVNGKQRQFFSILKSSDKYISRRIMIYALFPGEHPILIYSSLPTKCHGALVRLLQEVMPKSSTRGAHAYLEVGISHPITLLVYPGASLTPENHSSSS